MLSTMAMIGKQTIGNVATSSTAPCTHAETERLICFIEEATEVSELLQTAAKAACKALRHGFDSGYQGSSNREDLEKEIGQVLNAISLMAERGDIDMNNVVKHALDKRKKIGQWLHFQ